MVITETKSDIVRSSKRHPGIFLHKKEQKRKHTETHPYAFILTFNSQNRSREPYERCLLTDIRQPCNDNCHRPLSWRGEALTG